MKVAKSKRISRKDPKGRGEKKNKKVPACGSRKDQVIS
jgi:hypothetical protein